MGALFLNCFSVPPTAFNKGGSGRKKRSNCSSFVHCQGSGGKAIKTAGVYSVVKERSKMVNGGDRSAALMDAGSLIVSPNQADIAVKDLVPYGGSTTSLVELQDGIGIVKFLRGKEFFITGSTGFLAKGTYLFFFPDRAGPNIDLDKKNNMFSMFVFLY